MHVLADETDGLLSHHVGEDVVDGILLKYFDDVVHPARKHQIVHFRLDKLKACVEASKLQDVVLVVGDDLFLYLLVEGLADVLELVDNEPNGDLSE